MLAPGTRIAHFEIVERLGAGGMGEVYRARDLRVPRVVALKVLPPDVAGDEARVRRFETEAGAVAELSHESILKLLEFGRAGTTVYGAFELIEGTTLTAVLADGPLTHRKICDYGRQIAGALAAAHARGIYHRDVKPDNIMVTPGGRVTLLDFGLARRALPRADDTITEPGVALGTPRYMAPEQIRGEPADARTDIFALGAVLYEMAAGRAPFAYANPADVQACILRDDPPPLPPNVPAPLQRIIQRCLEKSRDERYQSAGDLALTLEAIGTSLNGQPEPLAPNETGARSSSRRWLMPGIAATAALAIGLGWCNRRAPEGPIYERATYRKGSIHQGRFGLGGRIVYGASWGGDPPGIYESTLGSRDAVPRGNDPAIPLAIAANGDILRAESPTFPLHYYQTGHLSLLSPAGAEGNVQNLDDVSAADVAPDDASIAVARRLEPRPRAGAATQWVIEWPIGNRIHETTNVISSLRIASDGQHIAWMEHPQRLKDTELVVMSRSGGALVRITIGDTPGGLAWRSPDEILFTAQRTSSTERGDTEIRAVSLSRPGESRTVLSAPGGLRLLDIARDGRILVSSSRYSMSLIVNDGRSLRDLNWAQRSLLVDLAQDGRGVVFWEDGNKGFDLYYRTTDGSQTRVLLRNNQAMDSGRLSADGRRVAISDGDTLRIIDIESGEIPKLPVPSRSATWLSDGRIVVWKADVRDNHPATVDLEHPDVEKVVSDMTCLDDPVISAHDAMACLSREGIQIRRPGRPTESLNMDPPGFLVAWSEDERALFLYADRGRVPASVKRLDLATGVVQQNYQELNLNDPAGVWSVFPIRMTRDNRTSAYSVMRRLDDLYVYRWP